MAWITLLFAFLAAFAAAFGASFLSLAWKRRRKPSVEEQRIEFLLPGYDCGLCGRGTCREYADAIDRGGADPALCSPGGADLEKALRSLLAERPGDGRAAKLRAIVRCGAKKGAAGLAFDYDNREDCATAAILYGGPKICKDGCLGFGSCAKACPLGAIRIQDGLAAVDAGLCSGCGACLSSCPKGLIALVPAEETWYVACSAKMDRELRKAACAAACDACGECVRRSVMGEFAISEGLARATRVDQGIGEDIARSCPTGAIRRIEPKKNVDPPSESPGAGL